MNANTAAIKLQSIWRGYVARREVRLLRRQEMAFLGMVCEIKFRQVVFFFFFFQISGEYMLTLTLTFRKDNGG